MMAYQRYQRNTTEREARRGRPLKADARADGDTQLTRRHARSHGTSLADGECTNDGGGGVRSPAANRSSEKNRRESPPYSKRKARKHILGVRRRNRLGPKLTRRRRKPASVRVLEPSLDPRLVLKAKKERRKETLGPVGRSGEEEKGRTPGTG